jgi:hypothetical protein
MGTKSSDIQKGMARRIWARVDIGGCSGGDEIV